MHAKLLLFAVLTASCGPVYDPDTQGFLDGRIVTNGCPTPEVVELRAELEDTELPLDDLEVHGRRFEAALVPGFYELQASADDCWISQRVEITLGEVSEVELELEESAVDRAPYLYLYPQEPTATAVVLPEPSRITLAEPPYPRQGWDLLAMPDGTLLTADERRSFLYYELILDQSDFQLERGWCAHGHNAQASIEDAMADMGFLPHEVADFADYWDPLFPSRGWWSVFPQGSELYDLWIQPPPTSLLRVSFVLKAGCHPMEPYAFDPVDRRGYHAAEWGVVLLDGAYGLVESGM